MKTPQKIALILASSSPRRIELLGQMGLKPEVIKPEVDETVQKGEKPRALVRRLSHDKAHAVAHTLNSDRYPHALVIAADTIVVAPETARILNKPQDLAQAKKMLRALSGRTHHVLTGFCILEQRQGKTRLIAHRIVQTAVKIRKLTARQIQEYIAFGESLDKAGAYAAQGAGGTLLIESIRGSYTNVVGLPTVEVIECLAPYLGRLGTR